MSGRTRGPMVGQRGRPTEGSQLIRVNKDQVADAAYVIGVARERKGPSYYRASIVVQYGGDPPTKVYVPRYHEARFWADVERTLGWKRPEGMFVWNRHGTATATIVEGYSVGDMVFAGGMKWRVVGVRSGRVQHGLTWEVVWPASRVGLQCKVRGLWTRPIILDDYCI